ncbi:RusA family crossover junction endodeoxyribonuclease [Paenisporosarcina quisquiliarum]|uniref:RusA family crossover junction endodeoxyribonuclease n=1 Tax=Paenisporosarcina quisquiliarum TaxID=365346 RepID=UPI0037350B4C
MKVNPFHKEEENEFEYQQYLKGCNPLWGVYRQEFNFPAIPYGNRNKASFKTKVQEQINDIHYYFVDEVKVEIILYLQEGRRYETPASADLDNYAKLLCDCIKGKNGILIDDIQIQHLSVTWFDTLEEKFEIVITGRTDDFIMKDIEFYEMPNGMYYPISNKIWTLDGIKAVENQPLLVELLSLQIQDLKRFRHTLHQSGLQGEIAYHEYMKWHPILRGFQKNRILESGFEIHSINIRR